MMAYGGRDLDRARRSTSGENLTLGTRCELPAPTVAAVEHLRAQGKIWRFASDGLSLPLTSCRSVLSLQS